jgi:hypothetical protein
VRSFLHDLPARYPERRVAVIGHSATKWAFDHILEGTPLDELVEGSFRWQARLALHARDRRLSAQPGTYSGPGSMGTITRPVLPGFAGADAPERWPRPRSAPRSDRLAASVETLQGVGADDRPPPRKAPVWQPWRTFLWAAPAPVRRSGTDEAQSSELSAREEAVIEVVVRSADESAA